MGAENGGIQRKREKKREIINEAFRQRKIKEEKKKWEVLICEA